MGLSPCEPILAMTDDGIVFQVFFNNFQNNLHNSSSRDALVCGVGDKALKKRTKLMNVFALERPDHNQDRMGLRAAGCSDHHESVTLVSEQRLTTRKLSNLKMYLLSEVADSS